VSSVDSIGVLRGSISTVHLFLKSQETHISLLYGRSQLYPSGIGGGGCFCEQHGLFKPRPPPPYPSNSWRTLRIQFRNCVDLWTTALCQRPLETVQRTIKVIGSGKWVGVGARLKIVFRSHTSASTRRAPVLGNDVLCHTNWPCGCAYGHHHLLRGPSSR